MMELPVLLVTDGVLFPSTTMRIPVRSKANIAMVDTCIVNVHENNKRHTQLVIVYREQDSQVGTIALIDQVMSWRRGGSSEYYTLTLTATARAHIDRFALPIATVTVLNDLNVRMQDEQTKILLDRVSKLLQLTFDNSRIRSLLQEAVQSRAWSAICDLSAALLPRPPYNDLLHLLDTLDVAERAERLVQLLDTMLPKMDRNNEQSKTDLVEPVMTSLLEKLTKGGGSGGGGRGVGSEKQIEALLKRLNEVGLPEEAKETVMNDFERFRNMNSNSPEHSSLLSYLQLVADLPWNTFSQDNIDLVRAREDLSAEHKGIDPVKKRILEFLAVRKLRSDLKGPIMCLVGPPGTGKSTIAEAIAATMKRKFHKVSLGGVSDQSEIRGHRRTYIGSMPGRIIQALRAVKTGNPVILLDEVDKMSISGVHGDPSAALLEVLFICTANDLSTIARPLADRMEILEVNGYTNEEKLSIANEHLVPRELQKHGLSPDFLHFESHALRLIIEGYTRESGVRQLQRQIGAVCRSVALKVAEQINGGAVETDVLSAPFNLPVLISGAVELEEPMKYERGGVQSALATMKPGMSFGLAWTPLGGEVLVVETSVSPGKGRVQLTGSLGEVLRESVGVALSWLRAHSDQLHFSADFFNKNDVHVHLPSGGVGKDGPSAGCALVVALASLATGRLANKRTAITGEVTLSGAILPVGGIKEKLMAARRDGFDRVILPIGNQRHIKELDLNELKVIFVSQVDQLLGLMLENDERDTKTTGGLLSKL